MRVPKGISKLNFQLIDARAEYDYKNATDELYFKKPPLNIPIEIP